MALPTFCYHPDPLASGSVIESDKKCVCCGQARGFIYEGPVYAEGDRAEEGICPWCIADGSAHEKFDATFVDSEAFGDGVPEEAIEEITERTPGFSAWQAEQWPACCGDAMAFLTPAGIKEIREKYREFEYLALTYIIYELKISGRAANDMVEALDKDQGPTAYLFRCTKCVQIKLFIDLV